MKSEPESAAAFLRNGKIFLHPELRTTQGVWIFAEPVTVASESSRDLGAQVLAALSQSSSIVAHPATWKGITDPLLRAAGVRSFSAFARSARCVGIYLDENGMALTPMENRGPGKGFIHLNDKAIRCQQTKRDAANALRAAFDACEQSRYIRPGLLRFASS